MFNKEIRFGYNDVMLQPATVSYVEHRSECNPFKSVDILGGEKSMLPIFTAPMSTVVDDENADLFIKNSIIPIVPRNIPIEKRIEMLRNGYWVALSMTEFETYLTDKDIVYTNPIHTLIDVANGHMEKIFQVSIKAKEIHKNIEIMAGNIANPATYEKYCEAGIDYVRVGIGGGSGCITSSNTAIHDGMASLLDDIWSRKVERSAEGRFTTKIIADGGIRGYSDVIKALALGADFVMIGSVLAKTVESSAPMYVKRMLHKNNVSGKFRPCTDDSGYRWVNTEDGSHYNTLYKEFYGMASKYGQIDINGKKTKTSEGIKKEFEVTTNLDTWSDNMRDYLRSAMSYCNINEVSFFSPSFVKVQLMSDNVISSVNK